MGRLQSAALRAAKTAGRLRYGTAQGLRVAWYGANMRAARQRTSGFSRAGEPDFKPENGAPDMRILRSAYFKLFAQDRLNIENGLYPVPEDVRIRDFPRALASVRLFQSEVGAVEARRLSHGELEVRETIPEGSNRYPEYYQQNFHYQSDGWFSDKSARVYDTQVEALFTGAADAMRRSVLAEISKELKAKDQRQQVCLDLACGTGRFLHQILQAFPKLQLSGLDLSPHYCEAARMAVRRWRQAEIIEGAAEAMPLEDNSVDIVTNIYLFHELPARVRPQVISEVFRILKPGGLFILADSVQFGDYPALDGLLEYFPHGFHEPYYKNYLSYDFTPVMQAAGFEPEGSKLAFLTKVSNWRKSA